MMPHIKTKKLFTATVTLILITIAIPFVVAENTMQQSGSASDKNRNSEVPGVPDNAIQYNKSDVIPIEAKEQIKAGEPALFQYKNMTILMNCSQNCEVVFNNDQEVTPKILGLTVDPNQTMTLTINMSKSPLHGEMLMQRTLNFYLDIEPNAALQLQAQIRLHINQPEISEELDRAVNTSRLTWMFWNQTQAQWQAVDSYKDQNGYLVCNTDHFSTWTVAEVEQQTDVTPDQSNTGSSLSFTLIIGVVAVVIVVLAIGIFVIKKK